jgi:hypothetical protein
MSTTSLARALRPMTYLAPLTALAAALSLFPGLPVAKVEGGAGMPVPCNAEPAWLSFELVTGQAPIPTNAVLVRALVQGTTCPNPPDLNRVRVRAMANGVETLGTLDVIESPALLYLPCNPVAPEQKYVLLWKPSAPLAPNATYALEVDSPAPEGAGGAGGFGGGSAPSYHASLPFTTAEGPVGALSPVGEFSATEATKRVPVEVCCETGSAGGRRRLRDRVRHRHRA